MKNTLEEIDGRSDKAEDRIGDLEDEVTENTRAEQQKERKIQKKWG